jgi:phage baseplate assembly protein W
LGGVVVAVLIPHFDLPFKLSVKHADVVEQDDMEDIYNCVEAVVRTEVGRRTQLPEFGIVYPVFQNQPIELADMRESIITQEPRAGVLIDQEPDILDVLVTELIITVTHTQEATNIE